MKSTKFIRKALGLNYDHLAKLLHCFPSKVKRAEHKEVIFTEQDMAFMNWLHAVSISWCRADFLKEQISNAHTRSNAEALIVLKQDYERLQKQLLNLEAKLEKHKEGYAFDLKALAALAWLKENLPAEHMQHSQAIALNYTIQLHKCRGRRFARLVKSHKQLYYLRAEIQCIEAILNLTFEDPDKMAIR